MILSISENPSFEISVTETDVPNPNDALAGANAMIDITTDDVIVIEPAAGVNVPVTVIVMTFVVMRTVNSPVTVVIDMIDVNGDVVSSMFPYEVSKYTKITASFAYATSH